MAVSMKVDDTNKYKKKKMITEILTDKDYAKDCQNKKQIEKNRTIDKTRRLAKLRSFDSLDQEGFAYLADNSYIRSGYRLHYNWHQLVVSLFQFHNETINVWTHMIGSMIFIALFLYVSSSKFAFFHQGSFWGPKYSSFAPYKCNLSGYPYIENGHHTIRLFASEALKNFEQPTCSPVPSDSLEDYQIANAIFDYSLSRLYHLENLFQNQPSSSMANQNFDENLLATKTDLMELHERLNVLADSGLKWLTRPSSHKIELLKESLNHRVDIFSKYLKKMKKEIEMDSASKSAIEEYINLLNSVRNGLKAMAIVDPNVHSLHHVAAWPLIVFLISAVICLLSSTIFHLLYVHSPDVYYFLSRLDYAGIAVMIAGSYFPLIYYSFHCSPMFSMFYLTAISTFGILTFLMSLIPQFGANEYIVLRTSIFLAMGCFGIIPVIHLVYQYGIFDQHITIIVGPLALMAILYIGGAMIYMLRFPERFYPGKFDYLFSSHQLWHVCVVAAALVHYYSAIEHYRWRWETSCDGY